jgi:hypothetical protein
MGKPQPPPWWDATELSARQPLLDRPMQSNDAVVSFPGSSATIEMAARQQVRCLSIG